MNSNSELIAETMLVAHLPNGEKRSVSIEIGVPRQDPKNAACPVYVKGISTRRLDICGEDRFQALTLAIRHVRNLLDMQETISNWQFYLDNENEPFPWRQCWFSEGRDDE